MQTPVRPNLNFAKLDEFEGARVPLQGTVPETTKIWKSRFLPDRHSESEGWVSGKYAQNAQISSREM